MTTTATVPDWATLTVAQQQSLLLCPSRTVDVVCEVLGPDLSFVGDISTAVDRSNSSVQWDGPSTVHRGCTLTLALSTELDWGVQLLRVSLVLTDDITGQAVRRRLGVFGVATAPDKTTGAVIEDPDSPSVGQLAYTVNGQDRTYLLDRQVGFSYVVLAGTNVLQAILAVFAAAGLSGVLIDGSRGTTVAPTDMVWPLVPSSDSSSTTDTTYTLPADAPTDDTSGPTTWRTVINDLLGLINYAAVWADETGQFRCGPYVDPATAPASFTFDADDKSVSPLAPARTRTRDLSQVPNTYTFIWSNMPDDDSGDPQVPSLDNGGIYQRQNDTDGPASILARGGGALGTVPTQVSLTAASADDFQAQADARFDADKRLVTTFTVSTVVYLPAGHYDVFTYRDLATVGAVPVKVQSTHWQTPLNGGDTQWNWQAV